MKKERVVLFFILIIFAVNFASAAVGVSPAFYNIDFTPNLKEDFQFNFLFDVGSRAETYIEGDLAKYVKINKDSFIGSGNLIASLSLPSEIEIPGLHIIYIGAKQISGEEGIGIVGNVRGVIRVMVPYPGKYAEATFSTTNANVGENVNFEVEVFNRGKEDLAVAGAIEIYNSNKSFEKINLESKIIETAKSFKFSKKLDTTNYGAGNYNASAIIEYGGEKPAKADASFRLGELHVGIAGYSDNFDKNKINKFDIEAESFWNNAIDGLYADVTVNGTKIEAVTPSVAINPWEKKTLSTFLDTSEIQENTFQANITLHYSGKTTSKIVDLHLKTNNSDYLIYAAAVLIAAIVLTIIIKFRRKNGKSKK